MDNQTSQPAELGPRLRAIRLLLPVILLLASTGCAFGTRHVTLDYPVPALAAKPSRNQQIYVAPVGDSRSRPEVVGHVLNGLGMKTAKVVARNDVTQWIRDALITELRHNGYDVVDTEGSAAAVSGTVIHVECDSYLNYEGAVHLSVLLRKNGATLIDRIYTGEDSGGLNFAMTSTSYAAVLKGALQAAVQKIVSDINSRLADDAT